MLGAHIKTRVYILYTRVFADLGFKTSPARLAWTLLINLSRPRQGFVLPAQLAGVQ